MTKKKILWIIIIGIQIIAMFGAVIELLKPLKTYTFAGEELICKGGVYLEDFINGMAKGYYIDDSLIPEDSTEELYIKMPETDLAPGSYIVTIGYDTDANNQIYRVSADHRTYSIRTGRVNRTLDADSQECQFSFESALKVDGYSIKVIYSGSNYIFVNDIKIEETNAMKVKSVFCILFLSFLVDVVVFLYLEKRINFSKRNINILLILGSVIFITSMPLFTPHLYGGHDIYVHLNRIEGIKNALEAGQFPVRMQQSYFKGYGYPISIYYCDLFLYFPAVLRMLGFSLQAAYKIYLFGLNVLTSLCMYGVGKRIFKNEYWGGLATVLYMLAPYRLTCMYRRAALGEATAMLFFPLIIYGIYKIYSDDLEDDDNSSWICFSLGFVGLLHCHLISTLIAVLFTGIFCLYFIRKTLEKRRIIKLIKSVIFALLLSAWFLFPLLEYMQYDIRVNYLEGDGSFANYAVYVGELFSFFPHGTGISLAIEDGLGIPTEMTYSIGGGLIVALFLFIVCIVNFPNKNSQTYKTGKVCMGFGILALFMTTMWFPWDAIEQMGAIFEKITVTIQFPWRFLSVATILLTIGAVCTVSWFKDIGNKPLTYVVVGSIIMATVLSGNYYINDYMKGINKMYVQDEFDIQLKGGQAASGGEYFPVNFEEEILDDISIWVKEEIQVTMVERYKDVLAIQCYNTTDTEQYIDVPIIYYRDYMAKDMNSGNSLKIEEGEYGRLRVVLPAGYQGDVHIRYDAPWYWRIYESISLISVVLPVVMIMKGKHRKKREVI